MYVRGSKTMNPPLTKQASLLNTCKHGKRNRFHTAGQKNGPLSVNADSVAMYVRAQEGKLP